MSICPHCQAELSTTELDEGYCRRCDQSLHAPALKGTLDASSFEESSALEETPPTGATHAPRFSPQFERRQRERIAQTYDLSDRSIGETIKSRLIDSDTSRTEAQSATAPSDDAIDTYLQFESAYTLLRPVGTGGMGTVWSARQESLNRDVAVKIPHPIHPDLDEGTKREKLARIKRQFISEVLVAARLDHPNIVPVYDMGTDRTGNPIYAMKLLEGKSWDVAIEDYSEEQNIEVLLKVCDAIAFAHAHDIVHLDIKPENIWLGEFGEVSVVDWGVAVRFRSLHESDWNVEKDGLPGLTPAYAAPEMFAASSGAIGPTTDVYLLGAVLYEIITKTPPHEFAGSISEIALKVMRNEIVPTEESGELLQIALRAMATEPEDRYPDAASFQDALRDYLSHRESAILARRAQESLDKASNYQDYQRAVDGFSNALELWARNPHAMAGRGKAILAYASAAKRNQDYELGLSVLDPESEEHRPLHRELTAAKRRRDMQSRTNRLLRWSAAVMAAVLIIGFATFSAIIWNQNQENRRLVVERTKLADEKTKLANDNASLAEQKQKEAERNLQLAEQNEQLAIEKQGEATRNLQLAARNEQLANDKQREAERNLILAARNEEIANVARESEADARRSEKRVLEVAYRSEINLAGDNIHRNAIDEATRILDTIRSQPVQRGLRHWDWGHLRYISSENRVVRDFTISQGKRLSRVESVAMSSDQRRVVAGTEDGKVHVWDESLQKVQTFLHGQMVNAVAITGTGDLLASGGIDEQGQFAIRLRRLVDGHVVSLTGHRGAILSLQFSADGSELLSTAADRTARIWRIPTELPVAIDKATRTLRGHLEQHVWSASYSPDEKWIVTAGADGFVGVWSRTRGSLVQKLVGHGTSVLAATFSSDGNRIVSAGSDGRLLLWNHDATADIDESDRRDAYLAEVERAIQEDRRNQIFTQRDFRILGEHDAPVHAVASGGEYLFSAGHDNTVKVWSINRGLLKTLRGHGRWVRSCDAAVNGAYVLSGGYDGRVRLWNWQNYHLPIVLSNVGSVERPTNEKLNCVALSPDGRWLATGSDGGDLTVWPLGESDSLAWQTLRQGHQWLATSGSFFAQGKRLLTSGGDNKAIIWDVDRGIQLRQFGRGWTNRGGVGWYGVAEVSPDGNYVVTGSDERAMPVRLWNVQTGEQVWSRSVGEHVGVQLGRKSVTAAAFSQDPQGSMIAVGDDQGRAYVFRRQTAELITQLGGHTDQIHAIAFHPDHRHLWTASSDGSVRLWSIDSGQELRSIRHDRAVTAMQIRPDGQRILTAGRAARRSSSATDDEAVAWIWNTSRTNSPEATLRLSKILGRQRFGGPANAEGLEATVRAVDFHTGGQRALVTSYVKPEQGRSAYIVGDWRFGDHYRSLRRFHGLSAARYTPDGKSLLAVGGKGAQILEINGGRTVRSFQQPSSIHAVSFSGDSERLVVAGNDGSLVVWQLDGSHWKPRTNDRPRAHPGGAHGVAYHPRDPSTFVSVGADGAIRLWRLDLAQGPLRLQQQIASAHVRAIHHVGFSGNGAKILTVGADGTKKLWRLDGNSLEFQLSLSGPTTMIDPGNRVACGALSSDGRWAVTTHGSDLEVWNTTTGRRMQTVRGHSAQINDLLFSHDDRRILSASHDSSIRVWDSQALVTDDQTELALSELLPLEGHNREVIALAMSSDGTTVVSADTEGQTILWPSVRIEPSIQITEDVIEYGLDSNAQLPVAPHAVVIDPTVTNFDQAQLVVALSVVGGRGATADDRIEVWLPPDFEFVERTAHRFVVRKIKSQRDTTPSQRIARQKDELAVWQEVIRSITYQCSLRTARVEWSDPDERSTADLYNEQAERLVSLKLTQLRPMTPSSADWDGRRSGPSEAPVASATIRLRLRMPQAAAESTDVASQTTSLGSRSPISTLTVE